ncbi:MAG: DUF4835 family protein [Salibacteraceae bacterium]
MNWRIASSLLALLVVALLSAKAQELNCSVQVNSEQVAINDRAVFEAMQRSVFEFMNNRRWTSDKYSPAERIDCSILINITRQISTDEYEADIQVSSSRPVFGSTYTSTTLRYQDEAVKFKFLQFDVLDFSENAYLSEFTSLLGFYAFVILATDYDTYSNMGGQSHWQLAQRIVANAQTSGQEGWQSFKSRNNRYWLVENALNNRFKPLREAYYVYHRKGFDQMSDNVAQGRTEVLKALKLIEKAHRAEPNSFNQRLFFTAKNDEIIKLFSNAEPAEKNEILPLLDIIDPANSTKYTAIKEGGR